MSAAPVAVLGAGGHAKVLVSTLRAAGEVIGGVFDDDQARWGEKVLGVTVQGPIGEVTASTLRRAVIAVGDNAARRRIAQRLDLDWIAVRHPTAWVDPDVHLGGGTVVFAGAIVQPEATIGVHVIINTGATVDHDSVLGDFVHLAPGVCLGGGVVVGEEALIGVGAAVRPHMTIGAKAVVGCGAAVVSDIDEGARVAGVPARALASGPTDTGRT